MFRITNIEEINQKFCRELGNKVITQISQYIKNHKDLSRLDLETVYTTIIALMEDNRLEWDYEKVDNKNV